MAIARSLVKKPGVLLLDEPFSNLDVIMRHKLRAQLKRIHEALKTTFVYVTHDQYDALSLADRIIILRDGIKQMDAPTADVYNYPVNRFCAEFIGSPVMNFLEEVPVSTEGYFTILGERFKLTRQQSKALRKNEKITVGIRGTNIEIASEGIPAVIEYPEMIESDLIIHLKVGETSLTAVEKISNPDQIRYFRDQEVHIRLDQDYFHIFNEDEERI